MNTAASLLRSRLPQDRLFVVSLSISTSHLREKERLRREWQLEEEERKKRRQEQEAAEAAHAKATANWEEMVQEEKERERRKRDAEATRPRLIFYSWQSDLDADSFHYLIRDALKSAINLIERADYEDAERPELRLDHDTKDTAGAVSIMDVILKKIDRCDVFVCDVSFVSSGNERDSPNPNVLIELGYAISQVGWDRIICVFNTACLPPGTPTDLVFQRVPFDLRGRRLTLYECASAAEKDERKQSTSTLSQNLAREIRRMLTREQALRATTRTPEP